MHPDQIDGVTELTSMDLVGDPHAEAKARSESELKQLANLASTGRGRHDQGREGEVIAHVPSPARHR